MILGGSRLGEKLEWHDKPGCFVLLIKFVEAKMLRKTTTLTTLICFILYLQGCSTCRYISVDEYKTEKETKKTTILAVVVADSMVYEFDLDLKPVTVENDSLEGVLMDGRVMSISLADISEIKVKQIDPTKTLLLVAGVIIITPFAVYTILAIDRISRFLDELLTQ